MTEQEPKKEAPRYASKEEVIEASRRRYATPRAEVERMIAKQMGYPTPEEQRDQLRDRLSHRLQGVGVTLRQAKYLLAEYPPDRIQQQLDWLPYRGAYNPAALIVAAIRRNYDPPEGLFVQGTDHLRTPAEDNGSSTDKHKPNPEQRPNSR